MEKRGLSSIVFNTIVLSIIVLISLIIQPVSLSGQSANLKQNSDEDFNKGYLNNMTVGSNSVGLAFKASSWGAYSSTAALPKALRNHQSTYWNKLVFVTGGLEVTGYELGVEVVEYSSTVYVADVNNGLANWRQETSLPFGISEHAAVVADGYLYVIGGMIDDLPSDKIYYSKLRADGSLREWQQTSVSLPAPVWGHTADFINGSLIITGGSNTADTTAVNTVYSSKINPDGSLATFTTEVNVLPANRNNHSSAVYNDRLFITGGYDETLFPVNTVYYSDIALDGSLGTWQTAANLPEPLYGHASTLDNSVLTLIGGYNDDQGYSVQYSYLADVSNPASLSWQQSGLYFEHISGSDAFSAFGKVYIVGGYDIFNNTRAECYFNTLNLSASDKSASGKFTSQVFELGIDRNVSDFINNVLNNSLHSFHYRTASDGGNWGVWTDGLGIDTISLNQSLRYVQYIFEINGATGNHAEALNLAEVDFTAFQLAGVINTNQTWTLANSPYWVTDDVFLSGNATITVEAGVDITFGEGTRLEVQNAYLDVNGTGPQPVTFTSFTGEDGYWEGLFFAASSNGYNSVLDYLIIENAGFQGGANLNVYNSNQPALNNGTIRKGSNGALFVKAGNPVLNIVSFISNKGNVIEIEAGGTGQINNPTFVGNTTDFVYVKGSSFEANALWDDFGLDYHIMGDLTVGINNAVLTINKGNTLRFAENVEILVYQFISGGGLVATGAADPDSMITFTSLNGNSGGWDGLSFSQYYSNGSSTLKYCIIENAKNNVRASSYSPLTFENSIIRNAFNKGFNIYNSTINITNCEFYGNNEEGIYGYNNNILTVTGSDFYNNGTHGFHASGNMTILNSDFYDNGGAGLKLTGYAPNVENAVIQNNGGNGLEITDCDPDFVNVDVLNNTGHGFLMNANVWPEYFDLVLSGNATNDFRVNGGEINHNVTWQVGQYPFIIIGTFSVGAQNATLTLEKGLTLKFAVNTGMTVYEGNISGGLMAEGTSDPDSTITFTSLNGLDGGWNGIYFSQYYSNGSSVLKHCIIEKGKDYNIYVSGSDQPTIENSIIRNSLKHGFHLYSGSNSIINCSIYENGQFGVLAEAASHMIVTGSEFYNNGSTGFSGSGNFTLLNSSIYDNGGTGLGLTGYAPTIENVVVQNNGSHGLQVTDCDPDFVNVDVLNNTGHGFLMNANVWPEYFDLVLSGNATNDFRVNGGDINHNITWQTGQYPFIVIGTFSVGSQNVTLTLEKGFTLKFAENTGITIYEGNTGGGLYAEGAANPDSIITFTSLNGQIGGWNGLYFAQWYSSGNSLLKHCVVEKGKDYNIYSYNSDQPLIDSTVIRESGKYGVHIIYGNPTIKRSQIVNNSSYGIYIDYGGNPIIGNAPGEGNDIFNNGGYDIFNSFSNNILASDNFWGTTDDAIIQQRIYDSNDDGSKGTVLYSTASLTSNGLLGRYASLVARYANPQRSKLDKVLVNVTGATTPFDYTSRTNKDGFSTFTNLPDQDYDLAFQTDRSWGGVNGTDALLVMKHFTASQLLTGINLSAADVNATSTANSTDAMLILQRFAHVVDTFAAGDWVFELNGSSSFNIDGSDLSDTIFALCYGDVNGSYIPASLLKSKSVSVGMSRKGTMFTEGNLVDLPVYVSKDLQLGAISLEIAYPEHLVDVTGLTMNNQGGYLMHSAENGTLRIAWISLEPFSVDINKPVFYISLNIHDMDALSDGLLFFTGGQSELADAGANVISGIELFYPEVIAAGPTALEQIASDHSLDLIVYPNPFSTKTSISYSLQQPGKVNLKIYNSLGSLVKVVIDEERSAGRHSEKWEVAGQSSGIYYYILEGQAGGSTFSRTGKLILESR